ncbi:hypothetical protein MASR2M29_02320 [Spirochaetota bacterium]
MKANKIMMMVLAAMVLMMPSTIVLMGCQPAVDPLPEPGKVYLTDSATFTRVDAAGTLAATDIYQLDTDADGTVDSPTVYYIGDNVEVTGYATGCFCITTSTDAKYLSNNFLVSEGNFYSDRWNTYYNDPDYGAEADIRFVDSGSGVTVYWTDMDYDLTSEFWVNADWSLWHWDNMGNIVEHAQSASDGHFEDFSYTWIPKP